MGWKVGQITALIKKGDKKSPANYRPVSLTSILCKVMEKLVRKRIVDHMNVNDLTVRFHKTLVVDRCHYNYYVH